MRGGMIGGKLFGGGMSGISPYGRPITLITPKT